MKFVHIVRKKKKVHRATIWNREVCSIKKYMVGHALGEGGFDITFEEIYKDAVVEF